MIEYAYREKFGNHKRVDWIIVPAGTVITPVSGEEPDIPEDTAYIIDTEHLISESISIKESICSSKNLKFGQMEESYISFIIANDNIPSLADEMIDIYLYFDQDSGTIFQVGQYIVDKDQYTVDRRQRTIQAFDAIKTLKDWDITEWYNDYFSDGQRHMIGLVLVSLFNWVRDEQDEYKDSPKLPVYLNPDYVLCNGLFSIGRTIESDTITFGFFMNGLLEFNGCFGHIGRDGRFNCLTLASYDKEPVRTVTDAFRLSPASYEDKNTWGIGQIDVYDRNNIKKFSVQNTAKKHPSIYVMADPFVLADRDAGDQDVIAALKKMHEVIIHLNYTPNQTECTGDLSVEVGDRYNVRFAQKSEYDTKNWYRSYVLERTFSGIQSFKDIYTAKGEKKQPKYIVTNDRWHTGDSTSATDGHGTGGVAELNDEHDRRLIEIMRNYGEPMLDEPTVTLTYNKGSSQVEITWSDPADISTYSPLPVEWAGTIVVRKEGKAPIHRWGTEHSEYGGEVLVDSTTRDEYSQTAFVDDTIEPNKRYYYAIMPYFVALDDAQHPIKHYRWTKVFSVDTARILVAPTLFPIQKTGIEGVNVTVAYSIPVLEVGQYEVIKLVAKKDSIPLSIADGDKAIDLTPTPEMIVNTATITGLDELSTYYFVIFIEDDQGNIATSEPMDCETEESKGITLFTDHFNQSVLVDGWDISVYRSIYSVARDNWNPIGASEDYLTSMNFMCGNSKRRPIIVENEVLRPNGIQYGMTDTVFWIPVKRTYFDSKIHISFEGKMSGYGQYYYALVQVACVENGTWYNLGGTTLSSQSDLDWHSITGEVDNTHQYVDYIGLGFCDGISYFRNIIIS